MTSSLRQRFLLIIVVGAVLPLAVAGAWLAQSAVRIAEGQLKAQLDTSVATIATRIEGRWAYRRSDELLLAGNEVTVRTAAGHAVGTSADSAYLRGLYDSLSSTVAEIRIVAADGTVNWKLGGTAVDLPPKTRFQSPAPLERTSYLADTVPIEAEGGRRVGTIEMLFKVSAILPADTIPILVKGAQLMIVDYRSGQPFDIAGSDGIFPTAERFASGGQSWIAVHRRLNAPTLDLALAAPTDDAVAPFARTARVGVLVFLAVIGLVIALSLLFTARVTRSLERLVIAADAVATGDLQRNVEANGRDEVGRLGISFNMMTESLRQTLAELSHREALAAVGEFAASLSHEVRNGLSAIRVDLQRVEEALAPEDESIPLVTRALRNTRRLDSTVTGVLAVARSAHAVLDPIDLGGVLAAAVGAAESAFASNGAEVSLAILCDGSCLVRADAAALEQLFLNLLLNAAQAMTTGGHATVGLSTDGADCVATIRDTGTGMAPSELMRSGEPFYTSKRGGTGLGLSIARKIAEVHGGSLAIESQPGAGTVVAVRLPRIAS